MKEVKSQKSKVRLGLSVFCVLYSVFCFLSSSDAKVYIDITSPAFRRIPITIKISKGLDAEKILEIVKDDLDFTGIFSLIDPDIPGAEIEVRINIETGEDLKAVVNVLDLIQTRMILNKRYSSSRKILRKFSHTIADDIFNTITGRKSVFLTKIAYILKDGERRHLYIMDWDGENPARMVTKGMTISHSWSPDGKYIVYSSERNKRWDIYSLNLDNYREMVLFSSKGLNLVGSVSHDNRVAFSSSLSGSPEIYIMNINGSSSRKITSTFGIDISPAFSSNGSRIAFVSDRGGTPQIYVMHADGTRLQRLTFEGNYNTSPVWSPDDRWIAFVGRKNGKNQIFMIQSDGIDLRQITQEGNNENPTFSPDGMFLAFDSDRTGKKSIYVMNIASGWRKKISRGNAPAMIPRWSPYLK
jgi:TolB protein